ncbi:MAG: metallophosphoesterase [Clostridia bacterium]|nr:metallophosphoesterase [Clostridia bacterium]
MKKTLALFLALMMVLPLFVMNLSALPAEADGDINSGLTIDSDDGVYPIEEYYAAKKLDAVPHTFSAWVYLPDSLAADQRGGVIIGNYTGVVNDDSQLYDAHVGFEIYTNYAPRLQWYDDDGGKHEVVFNTSVETNTWTQVVIVHDEETKEVRCYLNGEYAGSNKDTKWTTFYSIDPTVVDIPLMLGNDHRNSNIQYFKGGLKDVSLYADARTAVEIAQDYANGPDLTDSDLICAYDIDASDKGKDIVDETGNGYDMSYSKLWMTEEEMADLRGDTSDREYSFAVIGDTQYTTRYNPTNLPPIYQWIVDNRESKNIQYAIGLGDITDTDVETEWNTAKDAISLLDGKVPYSLVRGNHDVKTGGAKFLELFGTDSDYADQFTQTDGNDGGVYEGTFTNYGKVSETGSISNTWRTLEVGGDKWLLVNLDYGVGDEVLLWAGDVIAAHPEHRVIITTHGYLFADGSTIDNSDLGTVSTTTNYNNGDAMWDKLISRYENIEMVLCGHVYYNNIVVAQNKGLHGNTVTQMLIDAQSIDRTLGGLGMVAMFYFSEDGNNISVEYYSTVKNLYFRGRNQLEVNLDAEGEEMDTAWDGDAYYKPLGSGTAEDPYLVSCAQNLYWMSRKIGTGASGGKSTLGGIFQQICDIDLNGQTLPSIGYHYVSTSNCYVFKGDYYGNGYAIKNGSVSNPATALSQDIAFGTGIFGFLYAGIVDGLTVDNVTVSGPAGVGVIVGRSGATCEIRNCIVTDTCRVIGTGTYTDVTAAQWNAKTQNRLGGIVGHAANTSFENCVSNATVYTNGNYTFAGGIVGSIEKKIGITSCRFGGQIVNDFTDTSYNRSLEGENANGGIVGYTGTGNGGVPGTVTISNCFNEGALTILGTATQAVHFGGILGATNALPSAASVRISGCYNLNDTNSLGTQSQNLRVAGIVGSAYHGASATDVSTLTVTDCYSVALKDGSGAANVNTDLYTVTNEYIARKVNDGVTAPITVTTVETKDATTITAITDPIEESIRVEQQSVRNAKALKVLGYQKALEEEDFRVRVVFGVNTLELLRYGFEMTLTYTENGQTVTKTAEVTDTVVYTALTGKVNGEEVVYSAKDDYGCEYFATLIINPTIRGVVIPGEAVCVINGYTVDTNGQKICYSLDTVSLTFTDGVLTKPTANIQ